MNTFGMLYQYEFKKILQKKIVWIGFFLCLALSALTIVVPLLGDTYIEGVKIDNNYNQFLIDKAYEETLSGRTIDNQLLEETFAAYRKIPQDAQIYIATEEYQTFARPYSAIFNFVRNMTHMNTERAMQWLPKESDLYLKRQANLEKTWQDLGLSDGEKAFWRKKNAQIETPFVYSYYEGWFILLRCFQTIGMQTLLFLAISLSGIFPEEHSRRTDQLVLCSAHGKNKLYYAKLAAGGSFAAGSAFLFSLFAFLLVFSVYGTDGFHAAFQFLYESSSAPLTCGPAMLIAYGILIITAVLIGILVMILSELLHSSIAALAISTGVLILSMMVNIPEHYRVLAQIWDWLPCTFLTPWNIFDQYLLPVEGHYFTSWQAVPVLYLMAGAFVATIGKPIYQKYQVSGR